MGCGARDSFIERVLVVAEGGGLHEEARGSGRAAHTACCDDVSVIPHGT